MIAGWGNYPRLECTVQSVEDPERLFAAFDGRGTIARGLGRSYGDPAVVDPGAVLDLTPMDRFLAFDEASGTLTCEAGASLAQIIETFAPRGFFPAITPGTKHVTVGGCIANDVHGKAHHVDGCFSSCVEGFDLMLATGEVVRCDREQEPELFWATFGGMGLTGIVVRATIRLRPVESTYFRQEAIVVQNLTELIEAFDEYDARYPYSVAWIDPLATGARLGCGVLTVGDHASADELPKRLANNPLALASPPLASVPFELPNVTLNPLTLRALNVVIGQVQAHGAPFAHYEKFFYPLDVVGEWNRGYGRRGFTQYQFVIPLEDGERRMRAILERIASSGELPFLNVLKRFGRESLAPLGFPFEGYTFAIDFPISPSLGALCSELDAMVVDAGGRVYLGKDAFLGPHTLEAMYPRLGEWREVKARVDPDEVFRSHLSSRVGLTR